ncbi:MAG: hypothetical protein JSV47_05385 [Deltaproteobacteria bacterium]|nr:MAG: hypothetical protein JSV47_05385 [Deltaproteobacteria bacterium]
MRRTTLQLLQLFLAVLALYLVRDGILYLNVELILPMLCLLCIFLIGRYKITHINKVQDKAVAES